MLTSPCDVMVIPMTKDTGAAISAATAFRNASLRCQIYSETRKFKAKMSYADRIGVPYLVLIGEDEMAAGKLSLKNMKTGEQKLVTVEEAAEEIARTVCEKSGVAPICG